MKITLANLFNHDQQVIVKTYGFANQEVAQISHFPDFDDAVMYLVKNGYTIKLQDANEGGYSLWFEKVERKASQNDEAYTKMIAQRIANGDIDSFNPKKEESI